MNINNYLNKLNNIFYIHSSHKNNMRKHLSIVSLMILLMIIILMLPRFFDLHGIENYLPIHNILEMLSIVSASLIFAVGWNAYTDKLPANIIFISILFFSIALFDVSHLLSYSGMPDYITPSSPEKAINFWLAGRLTASLGLFVFVLSTLAPMKNSFNRYILFLLTLTFTIILHWIFLFHPDVLPRTFISGQGLTNYKIYSEYVIIGFHILTLFVIWNKLKQPQRYHVSALFTAVSLMVVSEFFFTLYSDVTDIYNLAGHIYKVIAYMYIYKVVFVTTVRRPYEALSESQEELINQNTLLDTVFKNLPNVVFLKDAKELNFIRLNSACEKLIGYSNKEVIGKNAYDLFTKEEADFFTQKDKIALETKQLVDIPEESLNTPQGIRIVHTKKVPIFDKDGEPKYLLGITEDITDIKKAREKEKILLDLIDSSNNEFYLLKKDTLQFTYASKGAMNNLQYTSEELQNMHSYDIVSGHTQEKLFEMHQPLIKGEVSQIFVESEHIRKDGTKYPVEVYLHCHNTLNNTEEFLAVVLDITERKENEKTIKDQESMMIVQSGQAAMGEMISMIAHQWRQPLSVVSIVANTLLLDVELEELKEEHARKGLTSINEQVQYMSKTIDDFRNFFKPSKNIETEYVTKIIDEVLLIIAPTLEAKKINLRIECPKSIAIETRKSEMKQVIINILSNAKDAMEGQNTEKTITIGVNELENDIIIAIANIGPHIPDNILNTIFDAYFTTKETSGGTGLGLYMSKSIMEKHLYGSIIGRNIDNGVEFVITIPKKIMF